EIATVMQTVDLSGRLVLEDADVVELRTTAPDVPTDGTNLALRAALALRDVAGSSRGVRITLEKRIPVAAGLGGGSTDAAAVLVGLSRLWGLRWPMARLAEVGVTLGMDVARSYEHARQIRARVTRARWGCWAVRALRGPAIRVR